MSIILMADDNRDGADSLAVLIQMYGYQTAVAYDGAAALARADSFAPDVVVVVVDMPVLTGVWGRESISFDACRALPHSHRFDRRRRRGRTAARH